MNRLISILLTFILLTSVTVSAQSFDSQSYKDVKKPKNIILMIGDGMGVSHVYSAYTVLNKNMNITSMPITGFSVTHSADKYITDSGAGGTAIATGKKTNNGRIAVDPEGKPLKTILEYASDKGLATGLISTSSITHATPASFIAHNANRNDYEAIAADFLKTDIDLFIGGGYLNFAVREDGRNLIDELKQKKYSVYRNLNDINTKKDNKLAVFLADKHLPSIINGRGDMLPDATEIALEVLQRNKKGFFIMIEGSQIDWGGHANNSDFVVSETVDFDKAVGKALEFAKQNNETLILITADHETGGYAINDGSFKDATVKGAFTTNEHSAVMVPVFAFGPGSELFSGVQDNTELFEKCMFLLNLE